MAALGAWLGQEALELDLCPLHLAREVVEDAVHLLRHLFFLKKGGGASASGTDAWPQRLERMTQGLAGACGCALS